MLSHMPITFQPLTASIRSSSAFWGAFVSGAFSRRGTYAMSLIVRSYQLCCGGVFRGSSTIRFKGTVMAYRAINNDSVTNRSVLLKDFHRC